MTARPPLVVYCRVSRVGDRAEDKFWSPQEQEERARAHAQDRGYAVGPVLVDLDVSGATDPRDRPGMSRALDLIRSGKAGGLVAFSIDRLSRDPAHGDWLVKEVTSHGGVVLAPDLPEDLDSPTGEFTFGMLLGVARLYRRTAGARFETAKERAVREGIYFGRHVPIGYRKRDEDRRMVLDPETAPVVAEVFERRVRGEGYGALARFLRERTGRPYSRASMPALLRNPLYYTGRFTFGEWTSEWDSGAIVDEATWHAAQRPKAVRDGRTSTGRWLLSGLLRCDSCGNRLTPWRPHKKASKGSSLRYRCKIEWCPARVSVRADLVEAMVVGAAFAESQSWIAKPPEDIDLAPLERELETAERRLAQMEDPDAQDAFGERYIAVVKERREARDAAAAALGEARAASGVPELGGKVLSLGHIWEDLDREQQRRALQAVFSEVRASKVPRGADPVLTFVVREVPLWTELAFAPVEIVPAD